MINTSIVVRKVARAANLEETFITVPYEETGDLASCIQMAQEMAGPATVIRQHIFYPGQEQANARKLCQVEGPPTTWTASDSQKADAGGIFLHTITGTDLHPITDGGRIRGYHYQDEHSRYCFLSGLYSPLGAPKEQAAAIFRTADDLLKEAGMSFFDVLRTWFYNDDILAWYDDFNAVRTQFFKEQEVWDHLIPASTGIGASNPHDAALTLGLFAVKARDNQPDAHSVDSPLQGPATSYGSSFSRAVLYTAPDHRRLTISGTASIDEEGHTTHIGDTQGQIEQTFQIVEALLHSQGFDWKDTVRGIGYYKHEKDLLSHEDFVRNHCAGSFPLLQTVNVVCRDNLLFELEVNAVQS